MALTITRVVGERVFIGDDIVVKVVDVRGSHARLTIEAPKGVRIMREELLSPKRWSDDVTATPADTEAQRTPAIDAGVDPG